jgi:hypothetical protein
MFTFAYVDLKYETSISIWDIWNDDLTLVIDLFLFHLAIRLNSQNKYETAIYNEIWYIICTWILIYPIGIIEFSIPRKWSFWLYFSPLHDYWPPRTWNSLVHNSWGEMQRCEERAFKLLKTRIKKISCNIKTKCVTDFLLTVRSSSMKDYICHYEVNT